MTGLRRAAAATLAILALAGCAGTTVPASGPLGVATAPPGTTAPAQSPAASPSEAPDVDSPDETDAPTAPPPSASDSEDGITGTWNGAWQNDPQWGDAAGGFTMTLTQHEASFDGPIDVTGPTCIRHGTSKGTLTGSHVSMGWIASAARDVDFEGTLDGDTMSGTWTAIACTVDVEISGTWSAQRQ